MINYNLSGNHYLKAANHDLALFLSQQIAETQAGETF